MEKPTIEEIAQALKANGFIFEQRVASIIEQEGFLVSTNKAYLDTEENKSREIDIIAHKQIFDIKPIKLTGLCYLICECKDSNNPFVFFTRKKMWGDKYFRPREIQLMYQTYFKNDNIKIEELDAFYYMELDKHFAYTKSPTKAVQVIKIIKNGKKVEAQSSGVVDSLIFPMAKAFLHHSGQAPKSGADAKYCKLFFNLIVVSSDLFTMDTEKEGALPKEVHFVPFVRDISLKGVEGAFLTFFVHSNYLQDFIRGEVFKFAEVIRQAYTNDGRFTLGPSLTDIL